MMYLVGAVVAVASFMSFMFLCMILSTGYHYSPEWWGE